MNSDYLMERWLNSGFLELICCKTLLEQRNKRIVTWNSAMSPLYMSLKASVEIKDRHVSLNVIKYISEYFIQMFKTGHMK